MVTVFANKLKRLLQLPLPGKLAQQKMSPTRRFPHQNSPNILKCKISSVMILLYEKDGEIHFPIIVRPAYDGAHSGQLSLPGGKLEEFDTCNLDTALRETEEEIGIPADKIHYLGALTNIYIPKSNFMVYPFIGYINGDPTYITNKNEVDSLLEIPISLLSDERAKSSLHFATAEIDIEAPCWKIGTHHLWGATAMILSELEELISKIE